MGFHPYLTAGGARADEMELTSPAGLAYEADKHMIPTTAHPRETSGWIFILPA